MNHKTAVVILLGFSSILALLCFGANEDLAPPVILWTLLLVAVGLLAAALFFGFLA